MDDVILNFIWLLIGALIGFFAAALCCVAHDADSWPDQEQL